MREGRSLITRVAIFRFTSGVGKPTCGVAYWHASQVACHDGAEIDQMLFFIETAESAWLGGTVAHVENWLRIDDAGRSPRGGDYGLPLALPAWTYGSVEDTVDYTDEEDTDERYSKDMIIRAAKVILTGTGRRAS